MSDETKIVGGGIVKGVQTIGGKRVDEKGVEIVSQHNPANEVTILDKDSKTETPNVEITQGEGDSGKPQDA